MSGQHAHHVRKMFGRIVPRYDLLNRLMSLGMDRRWRRIAVIVVKAARIKMVRAIGRVTRMEGSPRDITSERRKFDSIMAPRIWARTIGETG